MLRRWILYLAVVAGCLIFYCLYQEWLAWVLLLGVLWLPVLSAIISLPAMLTVRLSSDTPGVLQLGDSCQILLRIGCRLPCPPVRSCFLLREMATGEQLKLRSNPVWKPEHCGAWTITLCRSCVYDYMGLLCLPVGRRQTATVYIEPKPVPGAAPESLDSLDIRQWKPKAGGGFAENYELRQYRPGDNLRQLHWKMAAKTGTLIYRESMVPATDVPAVELCLSGTRTEQDEKLGKLLWVSRYLLSRQREHVLRCLTGEGVYQCHIRDEAALTAALHMLLQKPAAAESAVLPEMAWEQCIRIGGVPDGT